MNIPKDINNLVMDIQLAMIEIAKNYQAIAGKTLELQEENEKLKKELTEVED
jgi:hypothetical protein